MTNIDVELTPGTTVEAEIMGSGPPGEDGDSPVITVEDITGGHRLTIIDKDHPLGQTVDVMDGQPGEDGQDGYTPVKGVDYFDGQDGQDGQDGADGYTPIKGVDYFDGEDGTDGVSPAVSIGTITGGHSVTITDADHPGGQMFNVMDGQDGDPGSPGAPGNDGADGVSPEVTVTDITGGHRVTITDADHPLGQTFDVMDGEEGPAGQGVPSGGSAGQVLVKHSGADRDTEWKTLTAADVGAVAADQGSGNAGKFLVVGNDGIVVPVTLATWQGGSY